MIGDKVCFTSEDYLKSATWMKGVINFVKSAEQYFIQVEENYNEVMTGVSND